MSCDNCAAAWDEGYAQAERDIAEMAQKYINGMYPDTHDGQQNIIGAVMLLQYIIRGEYRTKQDSTNTKEPT